VHDGGGPSSRPFIHVNCASIPETLFESEMFGYERGSFTGALQGGKRGFIESAAGGTLFLDEIGEMPLAGQAKLLKFLEDGTIQP
uniref:sigma 54-interacting transcriptional regulator n=1 Tax=Enterobacter hormaechei TaxID=158836 RepID=UPI0013D6D9B2